MQTISDKDRMNITEILDGMHITSGRGNKGSACSMVAINLGLTGHLTDATPDCMSRVIGRWIMNIQDKMPSDIRNSPEWKSLLPLAAGTGQSHEKERSKVLLDWMWVDVLPQLQNSADSRGFGVEWTAMCNDRTQESAWIARDAAYTAAYTAADATAEAADAAGAADATAEADAAYAAEAVADAAGAADAAYTAADAAFWVKAQPVRVLAQLIEVTHTSPNTDTSLSPQPHHMNEPAEGYEVFSDMCYYDLWAARKNGVRTFGGTAHFETRQEAVAWTHDPDNIAPPSKYNQKDR